MNQTERQRAANRLISEIKRGSRNPIFLKNRISKIKNEQNNFSHSLLGMSSTTNWRNKRINSINSIIYKVVAQIGIGFAESQSINS